MIKVLKEAFGKHYPKVGNKVQSDEEKTVYNRLNTDLAFWCIKSTDYYLYKNKQIHWYIVYLNPTKWNENFSDLKKASREFDYMIKFLNAVVRSCKDEWSNLDELLEKRYNLNEASSYEIIFSADNTDYIKSQSDTISNKIKNIPIYDKKTGEKHYEPHIPFDLGCEFFKELGGKWYPVYNYDNKTVGPVDEAFGKHYPKKSDEATENDKINNKNLFYVYVRGFNHIVTSDFMKQHCKTAVNDHTLTDAQRSSAADAVSCDDMHRLGILFGNTLDSKREVEYISDSNRRNLVLALKRRVCSKGRLLKVNWGYLAPESPYKSMDYIEASSMINEQLTDPVFTFYSGLERIDNLSGFVLKEAFGKHYPKKVAEPEKPANEDELYYARDMLEGITYIYTLGYLLDLCNKIVYETSFNYHQRSNASDAMLEWRKNNRPSLHLSALFQEALGDGFLVNGINDGERVYLLQKIKDYNFSQWDGCLLNDTWYYCDKERDTAISCIDAAKIINNRLSDPIFDDSCHINESFKSLTEDKHEELNDKIWDDNNELKPEVRNIITKVVNKFLDNLREDDIPIDVDDVLILGSNANYNYTENSDLDVHIIADMSKFKGREEELAEKLYLAKKTLFNDKYDPEIRGIEIELYVEPLESGD